ncbi:MAG: trypsin-like peptidase domain-containing protein [Coraliomargarita sp.]
MIRFIFCLTFFALNGFLLGQGVVQPFPTTQPVEVVDSQESIETLEQRVARLRHELAQAEHALAAQRMQFQHAGVAPDGKPKEEAVVEPKTRKIPTGALVVIRGAGGAGSGFIAELKGRTFLVTNIHVLGTARGARFKTINGEPVEIGSTAFVCNSRDIAILPVEWEGPCFEVSRSLTFDEVAVGQEVVVMGNSGGASVATRLRGKIKGIGPDEIEVSAKFVPGNSGSPIIHEELGMVVGIASYLRDFSEKTKWTKDSELGDIRRFGYRMDGDVQWQRIDLSELFAEADAYYSFEDRTKAMWEIGYRLEHESKLVTSYRDHESLGHLYNDINSDFNWGRGTTSSRNIQILQRFVRRMKIELHNDIDDTDKALTVNFYRSMFSDLKPMRERIEKSFKNFEESRL